MRKEGQVRKKDNDSLVSNIKTALHSVAKSKLI